jgi:site-specific DNA recombinase
VRHIFQRFVKLRSPARLAAELNRAGHRMKAWKTSRGVLRGGGLWHKVQLCRVLHNVKYIGLVPHKGQTFPGERSPIVPQKLWDEAHAVLARNPWVRSNRTRAKTTGLLKDLIKCGPGGCAMGLAFTKKHGKSYRYYLCVQASKKGYSTCPVRTLSAGKAEDAVIDQLRAVFRAPEIVARTFRAARALEAEERRKASAAGNGASPDQPPVTELQVMEELQKLDPVWDQLFPEEKTRLVQLLVERVTVLPEGLELRLRAEGLHSLAAEVGAQTPAEKNGAET